MSAYTGKVSTTRHLLCQTCKESLLVGDPRWAWTLQALGAFVVKHEAHALRVVPEHVLPRATKREEQHVTEPMAEEELVRLKEHADDVWLTDYGRDVRRLIAEVRRLRRETPIVSKEEKGGKQLLKINVIKTSVLKGVDDVLIAEATMPHAPRVGEHLVILDGDIKYAYMVRGVKYYVNTLPVESHTDATVYVG